MNTSTKNNPEDIHVGVSFRTSKQEYLADPKRWEAYAEDFLMKEIAHFIQKERSRKIEETDMVEKRLELYVATPEVFWNIVNREAEKIAMRFMRK